MKAERNADGRHWAGGDVEGVEHDEIGAVLGSPTNDGDQPAVAFRRRFRGEPSGPDVVGGVPTAALPAEPGQPCGQHDECADHNGERSQAPVRF